MQIDVAKLKNIKGAAEQVLLTGCPDMKSFGYDDISLNGGICFNGTVENGGDILAVRGQITGVLSLLCSRCLEPFDFSFDVAYEESFTNHKQLVEQDAEEQLNFFSGDYIDITETALRQIFLEIPMQTLCSDDCRGLCPHCGTNLNLEQCDCGKDNIDPRLAKLQCLLNSMEKGDK